MKLRLTHRNEAGKLMDALFFIQRISFFDTILDLVLGLILDLILDP